MNLLNWDGIEDGAESWTLRKMVEYMRKGGALVEILAMQLERGLDEPVGTDALELILEAGRLVERLGTRVDELLEAQGKRTDRAAARKLGARTAKRRTA